MTDEQFLSRMKNLLESDVVASESRVSRVRDIAIKEVAKRSRRRLFGSILSIAASFAIVCGGFFFLSSETRKVDNDRQILLAIELLNDTEDYGDISKCDVADEILAWMDAPYSSLAED